MATARRTSSARQRELTDAALHLIATQGIAALSTRSLAAAVGLSTGAIFRHFATLDALLDAVVARVETLLDETYPPSALPPVVRLERFIAARSTAVAQHRGIPRLLLSEQFLLALPAHGSARLTACVRKTQAFVLGCVRDGQAAGELRADLPAETLTPIVMGTVQMLALRPASAARSDTEPRAVVESLLALLRPATPAVRPATPSVRPATPAVRPPRAARPARRKVRP